MRRAGGADSVGCFIDGLEMGSTKIPGEIAGAGKFGGWAKVANNCKVSLPTRAFAR